MPSWKAQIILAVRNKGTQKVLVTAIVPAAGSGRRLKADRDKPYILLKKKPIIIHTLQRLSASPLINEIILAVSKKHIILILALIKKFKIKKIKAVVTGGRTRSESVYNGIKNISDKTDIVLIHDGVRPLIDNKLIAKVIKAAKRFKAAVLAVPVVATVKESGPRQLVKKTLVRNKIWAVQTPQAFERDLIITAYSKAGSRKSQASDDAFLVEKLGYPVKIVKGLYSNIKVTTKEDLILAEAFKIGKLSCP